MLTKIQKNNTVSIKTKIGFTLIELLVVIAIIGLLSTIVLVATQGVRQKSRDGRRVAELKEIRTALELYYDDGNTKYPSAATFSTSTTGKIDGTITGTIAAPGDIDAILAKYMNGSPKDPINDTTYYLFYDGSYNCGAAVGTVAVLFAKEMETTGFDNANIVCTPTGETVTADYYVVLGTASP